MKNDSENKVLYTDAGRPEAMELRPKWNFGRLLVARRPDTLQAVATGWDCDETRKEAKAWLAAGLRLELVGRELFEDLLRGSVRHVFETTGPVGELLSPQAARGLLSGY